MSAATRKADLDAAHAAVRVAMNIIEERFHSNDDALNTAYGLLSAAESNLAGLAGSVPAFAVASGERVAA